MKTCKLPPLPGPAPPSPPPPRPPSPKHILPFHVVATPSNGDILVKGPSTLPAQFAPLDRQEPVAGSINGDYKPVIAQLNNSDLLMVFRTHQPGPLHAVFLRSQDDGRSWVRDESQTHLHGNEFGLHSLSDGTVVLMDGGNGTAAAIYRSEDWGHSFQLSQVLACKELGWSALEENGTWAPAGVYLFADSTIYRCSTRAENCVPHQVVADMNWADGDTFFGQSTVFRSWSGILRHVARVGVDASWDQTDGSQLWYSVDPSGASWVCSTVAAGGWCNAHSCAPTQHRQCANVTATFGWPGIMYSHFLQLSDGRVLNTFTQRCNGVGPQPTAIACGGNGQGDGFGTGLRALVSTDNEGSGYNFSHDLLVLSAQDDNNNPFISGKTAQGCMCGYGGTVQLADGTLLTPYCYTNVTTEMSLIGLVRWTLPATLSSASLSQLKSDDHQLLRSSMIAAAAKPPFLFPNLGVSFASGAVGPNRFKSWRNFSFTLANFTNSSAHGPWTLAPADALPIGFRASISMRPGGGGFFDLEFKSERYEVPQITFPNLFGGSPMDRESGLVALYPLLGGIFIKAGASCYGDCMDDFVMDYPGQFHSPYAMLCTTRRCLISAATVWPPHHVRPKRRMRAGKSNASEPFMLEWVDGYRSGTSYKLSAMLTETVRDDSTKTAAWQAAVLAYRGWLSKNKPRARTDAPRDNSREGMWAIGLQNECMPPSCSFNMTVLDHQWRQWRDVLGRVQFWGQMSNYGKPIVLPFHCFSLCFTAFPCRSTALTYRETLPTGGDPRDAKPPLLPGEQVGCCLRNRTIHRRYTDADLPGWARGLTASGRYDVGYYTRTLGWDNSARLTANVSWFKTWLDNMAAAGGNAQYVDQFARTHNGRKLSEVLQLFEQGIPPANVITEGWSDYMPFAGQSWLHALRV